MEILVAKSGGFCRGVKKAVDTALAIEPENTYIFGEIIHNREVVDTITERGIVTVETLSAVPDGATLIIRSHGAAKSVLTNARRGASKRWTAPAICAADAEDRPRTTTRRETPSSSWVKGLIPR